MTVLNEDLLPMAFLPYRVLQHPLLSAKTKLLYAHMTSLLNGRTWVDYEAARDFIGFSYDPWKFGWSLATLKREGLIRIDDLGEEGKRIYLVDFEVNPADEDEY